MTEILVHDIMSKPVTIAKSAPLTEALQKMLREGVDPLIAVHNNTVTGTVSRRSIANKLGSKKTSDMAPAAIHVSNVVNDDFTIVYEDQEVDVLLALLQSGAKLAIVYDSDNNLIGQVTYGDLLHHLHPSATLLEILEKPYLLDVGERVVHLRRVMMDENVSHIVVTNDNVAVGIVSETDIAVAMKKFRESVPEKHQDTQIRNLLAEDIMTSPVITMDVSLGLDAVIDTLLEKKISAIPITDSGKVIGILTRKSAIMAL
ncbi:MAG: CBS domain-containing protein [Methanomicrobiales archaeon]|jgi:predicted transcriptional regulator|nr:CBS domain-containing protein [Methanomicrobiales archaeon]